MKKCGKHTTSFSRDRHVGNQIFLKRLLVPVLVLAILFSLSACSDSASAAQETGSVAFGKKTAGKKIGKSTDTQTADAAASQEPAGSYEIPEFKDATLNAEEAEGNGEATVDMSSCSLGYVAMRVDTDSKIKFQVIKDDITYTYSVVNYKDQIFPLQSGDGHYVFKVMENVTDNKYAELYKCETDVTIENPYDPFLRPNQYADYTTESECVIKAHEFAENASDTQDFVKSVYDYVCKNVTYDDVKAANIAPGYLPDPDLTLDEKKGICFDYACLTACMLRSQGVPTKIIFGYVAPDDIYHAWNKFYTEEDGWTTVEFTVNPNDWTRIDLTFSANGANNQFIGDGSNYAEAYEY